MRKVLFLLILLCVEKALHAQYIYTIKADSVKITNSCDTAELIIENRTQNIPGFLFNKGRGRTEFRRISQFDDTTVVIGGDTIHLGRGDKHFGNADLTFTGDRIHNGLFRSMKLIGFGELGFKSNTTDGKKSTEMILDTFQHFNLTVQDLSDPGSFRSSTHLMNESKINIITTEEGELSSSYSELNLERDRFSIVSGNFSNEDGSGHSFAIRTWQPDFDPRELEIGAYDGNLRMHTSDDNDRRIEMKFNGTDSLRTNVWGGGKESRYSQTDSSFFFTCRTNKLNFRLENLPASTSSTDSMLVVDNYGFVKKRPQSSARKSTTVTGASYTIPADIDVVFVNYAAGQATITLPTGTLDREITIKNLSTANTVILSGLDTYEPNSIAIRGAITVKYTGSAWEGISKY